MDAPPTLLRMAAVGHFEGVTSGYRPQLDGVRTIAVYLVVAFHAGLAGFAGGFIGVDIFFVLSVYLITGLLLRELEAGGRIRLSRFYARRYRRLLPAALVVLVVTAIVDVAIASRAEAISMVGDLRAAGLTPQLFELGRASNRSCAPARMSRSPASSYSVRRRSTSAR